MEATQTQVDSWKKEGASQAVRVLGSNGKETQGEVYIRVWNQKDRMVRAFKSLGMCWGGAIVAVFIPLMHFILVPAFFLAGLVLFGVIYKQGATVLGGLSSCPQCGEKFPVVQTRLQWPLKDVCGKCFQNVTITPLNG